MKGRWSRTEIKPGDLFVSPTGRVYEVSGIADSPTVLLCEVGQKAPEYSYVISSPQFSEFAKLEPRLP